MGAAKRTHKVKTVRCPHPNVERIRVQILMMPETCVARSHGSKIGVLTNDVSLWAFVCGRRQIAHSSESVWMPCGAPWAAVRKDEVGWTHLFWRNHLTHPVWLLSSYHPHPTPHTSNRTFSICKKSSSSALGLNAGTMYISSQEE